MATIHLARQESAAGIGRVVAIKRLQKVLSTDAEFVKMFLDEARITTGIEHPNVIKTIDVIATEGELMLVMELVRGDSLSRLLKTAAVCERPVPLPIVSAVVSGALEGLHAAHEACDARGHPLQIVHRDVSPHNILVGTDGIPRIADFGIAKALGRSHVTKSGEVKGKLAYMAPEQIRNQEVDRRVDVYASAVVLWEALTGQRLFDADNDGALLYEVLEGAVQPPSTLRAEVPAVLDAVVLRGLARDPAQRFGSALDMAHALEAALTPARPRAVGEWVLSLARDEIDRLAATVQDIESGRARTPVQIETGSGPTRLTGTAPATVRELAPRRPSRRRAGFTIAAALAAFTGAGAALLLHREPAPSVSGEALGAQDKVQAAPPDSVADVPSSATSARPAASHAPVVTVATSASSASPSARGPSAPPRGRPAPEGRQTPTTAPAYPYEF